MIGRWNKAVERNSELEVGKRAFCNFWGISSPSIITIIVQYKYIYKFNMLYFSQRETYKKLIKRLECRPDNSIDGALTI